MLVSALPAGWFFSGGNVRRIASFLAWGVGASAGAVIASLMWGRGSLYPRILARVYDERIDRFLGFLTHMVSTPWGGQAMKFVYVDHQKETLVSFNAAAGDLLHNVPFDVVVRVGLIPALLLLATVLPLFWRSLARLRLALLQSSSAGPALILGGCMASLAVQWLFQPLIYSDGLLFYLGFLLLGYLAVKLPTPSPSAL